MCMHLPARLHGCPPTHLRGDAREDLLRRAWLSRKLLELLLLFQPAHQAQSYLKQMVAFYFRTLHVTNNRLGQDYQTAGLGL